MTLGRNCFPAQPLLADGRFSYGFTALCCVLTALPFAPQYVKFALRDSAEGVSRWTLALIIFTTWLQVLNLLVLHWDELSGCAAAGDIAACDHSLTTLAYVSTSFLVAAPLLPFALWYTPAGPEREAGVLLLAGLGGAVLATGLPVLIGLALYNACTPLAPYASFLGLSTAGLYILVYLPQLLRSLALRRSGSLSYGFLVLHLLLGVGSAAQKALGTHERVVTWAPPLSANVMQLVLIIVNLWYDLDCEPREETAALLESREAHHGEGGGYGAVAAGGAGKAGEHGGRRALTHSASAPVVGGGFEAAPEEEKHPHTPRTPLPLFSRPWWERYL